MPNRTKGHPRGGLFISALAAALGAALAATACGPPQTAAADAEPELVIAQGPGSLQAYRNLGFIVGDRRFPVVGRFIHLPGPGDSTYTGLALSMPNSALRFRREESGFLARYEVELIVGDTAMPIARLSETKEVRVRTFRETSRRGESVIFQGFLTLPSGKFPTQVRVRDLASSAGLAADVNLRVPRFEPMDLTAPILIYRGELRSRPIAPPSLILNPRATVEYGTERVSIYVEADSAAPSQAILEVVDDDQVTWSDTVELPFTTGPLRAAVAEIDVGALPPGRVDLRIRFPDQAASSAETLLVTLRPGWTLEDYQDWVSYLRYAGTPVELDSLGSARPGERAQMMHTFLKRRDPDPQTRENEFLERYFRRIQDANNRFSAVATEGWLTDRGAVYVTLGPPDEVLRHLDDQEGPGTQQVWLYNRSLDFELRLVFVDSTGSGSLDLSVESRRLFADAVARLYS